MPSDRARLTKQQRTALDDLLAFAHEHDVSIRDATEFDVSRANEHGDIRAHYSDSDHVIAAHIDPYGHTGICFGTVDWTHLLDVADDCTTCNDFDDVHVDGRPITTVHLPVMKTPNAK